MKRGKKCVDDAKLVDHAKLYDPQEALKLYVRTDAAKFGETVEVHVKLGVDGRHVDQQIRGTIIPPNDASRQVRVLAICKGDNQKLAEEAGAEFVGAEDMVQKIQAGNQMDFDVLVTTPDMTDLVDRLGKVLGPRGLIPNPKTGTVASDIAKAVREIKAGRIEYRPDKTNIIHCPTGKVSFGTEGLQENFSALLGTIVKAKPTTSKSQYIKSCAVTSTIGPGVRISPSKVGGM